jgi:hypothetical protein
MSRDIARIAELVQPLFEPVTGHKTDPAASDLLEVSGPVIPEQHVEPCAEQRKRDHDVHEQPD